MTKNETIAAAVELVRSGVLSVDECGRIWRLKSNGNAIAPRRAENPSGHGYLRVTFQRSGGLSQVMAHRLVWVVFRGDIPDGLQINHKDGNKRNNSPDNLEVVTPAENIQHSYRSGRTRPWSRTSEWRGRPIVSNQTKDQIREARATGVKLVDLAARFGLSVTHTQRICKGEPR